MHGILKRVLKLLAAAGVTLTILGLILIPLPGPGMLLLVPGVLLLVAALLVRATTAAGNRKPAA
ncbi:hypothetical protein GCM10027080_24610 [Pedococcus soli]